MAIRRGFRRAAGLTAVAARSPVLRRAVRRLPGAPGAARGVRAILGRSFEPVPGQPPAGPPAFVAARSKSPAGETFITGNGIAARCGHVINFDVLTRTRSGRNDWWFCRTDYLEYFFAEHAPDEEFVLFSHNSDRLVDARFLPELEQPRLRAWFAQNPAVRHPKLRALPIGVANPNWPHGDQDVLGSVQREPPPKTAMFDASFNPETNSVERRFCLEQTGLELAPRVSFEESLRRLAAAWFCISPNGNGIDCHRTWEALYVRTIPVVTRSLVTEQHEDVPMIVLDDWSQFASIKFSPELYERVWNGWDPAELRLDRYLERIDAVLETPQP